MKIGRKCQFHYNYILDLDLDDNCQSPVDIATMECARLRARYSSWLLKDDTEANEVMESGHSLGGSTELLKDCYQTKPGKLKH